MIGKLAAGALMLAAVPAIAIVTALGIAADANTCIEANTGQQLTADAPVPADARDWIGRVRAECPELPETWVAAVMAQESGFRPDAYADDANGGTWGLFQMNNSIWTAHYGHPWSADLNTNGTWDIKEPQIHATVAGKYLCARLAGVRQIRAEHPDWASSSIPELDALIIAHNAGESRLRTYPQIPEVTRTFIANVADRTRSWAADPISGAQPEPLAPTAATTGSAAATTPLGCTPQFGQSDVVVPAGTAPDTATAVRNALAYVGVTSGWHQLCDRLACRAYGYATSGYPSATSHWHAMLTSGHAHPRDRCPPLGSFVFYDTGRPFGHVSIVVQADPTGCDPNRIQVTSNGIYDAATGNHGGVYLLSLQRLHEVYPGGYLGWSSPVCRGSLLDAAAVHPVAASG